MRKVEHAITMSSFLLGNIQNCPRGALIFFFEDEVGAFFGINIKSLNLKLLDVKLQTKKKWCVVLYEKCTSLGVVILKPHTHTLLVFQGQQPHTPTENGILRELSEEKGRVKLTHEEKLSGTF